MITTKTTQEIVDELEGMNVPDENALVMVKLVKALVQSLGLLSADLNSIKSLLDLLIYKIPDL